ncbi:hypothetical protein JTB14_015805 [Gonioctena quinquepunctata]|nr:hypothetical protein JTB14_015805 [Gonioctena quinquepunctata]
MASVYHLYEDAIHVQDDVINKYKEHAMFARKHHFAATGIQSVFRKFVVKKKIENLKRAATVIQKHVRGWLLRYHLPDMLHEYYDLKSLKLYNEMATKIQARWKGYQVRRYEVCIKDVLEDRAKQLEADERIRQIFTQHRESKGVSFNIEEGRRFVDKLLAALFDRHHLLSTHQKEGVLSIKGQDELSELEKFLKSISWAEYMKKVRKIYNSCANQREEHKFEYKELRKQECLVDKESMHKKVIHEKPFVLTTKIERKPYERLRAYTEQYTAPQTDVSRSFDVSKNISEKDFDLCVFKKCAKESNVPPYYIDFWLQECHLHNL